ncbi:MAG TPA: LuxR C-terminal-related transcriptional regulator [Gaiellaceae bacterium]|nr:LuxR C-terminal-related transcriptional regulator [Gaiellaceae bacterium]
MASFLEEGRRAFAARAWADAGAALARADSESPLSAADLEALANAYYMLGRVDDFLATLDRAHRAFVAEGEPLRAARAAFFVGVNLALRGELGPASGWWARAQRLVEREGRDCAERGYLMMPVALQHEGAGDYGAAFEAAGAAARIAERFGDRDLFALAVHTQGLARIREERLGEGLALLDEAMLAATAGELSPVITGVVYCGVIAGCEEAFEPRRAREWTDALSRWCEEQPDLVAFGGRCQVHRAEIMRHRGAWGDALREARQARERCERAMNRPAAGQALYQQGEVLRLRGEHAAAETAYLEANGYGHEPQPGLALLRLGQGAAAAAAASIRRALAERTEPLARARLLPAHAEIMLAVGDADEARRACDELEETAVRSGSPLLLAEAEGVRGTVQLAEGRPEVALQSLRRAWRSWQELEAPYAAARARVQVARACRALGDDDTAVLELDAARVEFERLGAAPDAALAAALAAPAPAPARHGLTRRELEVLRLLASGRSNRQIAAELVVSEHTVARHVQNIFGKLRVSSRAAATAFAFEHDLV